ncbi:type IV conjugative transfer system coupling protein TraD [Vibrio europaeus]|uniref:type IV conjugative transfer system coupling protein TraD n=1 Tax=Vibrio europaeus TaxID=300876 RepID=UPI00233F0135|nr:type IV conjugative transfer system coupling protein TraD [Vibrio europaeus]MDC5870288.1 type IV conjugative transfer system coupling protein TraD [Vibrio europaeus]
MSDYPVERLLRDPVELYAAGTSFSAGILCATAPQFWLMTPTVAYASMGVFGWITYKYTSEGVKVLTYQSNIKKLKKYEINPRFLKVSQYKSFVGRGFRWMPRHTQRLNDVNKQENERYVRPSAAYDWARRKEAAWENTFLLNKFASALRSTSPLNPLAPWPDVGGIPAIHGVGADEENDVYWSLSERPGHCLVLGTTRVGKTRLEEILASGDILRGDNVVIVIDPKGDGDLYKRLYTEAIRAGREDNFYFFHMGYPEQSCRYNPIGEFQRVTEVAGKTTAQLADGGNSAAFKAFSWRFVNIVAQSIIAVGLRPTMELIAHYVQDMDDLLYKYALKKLESVDDDPEGLIEEAEFEINDKDPMVARKGKSKQTVAIMKLMKELLPEDVLGTQLCHSVSYEKSYYEKLVASLVPFLDKLNTGAVAKLLSPDYFDPNDKRDILSWRDVIQRKGIVYIGLDALTDREVATAVGNAMFNDLVSVAGDLYKNGQYSGLPGISGQSALPEIFLHADEFNSLCGDEFVPMVNQSGGAGIRIVAYTQTVQDIEAKLGNSATAQQIIGNFNTLIMMRVQNEETAKLLTGKLGKVTITSVTDVSGSVDKGIDNGQSFTANNQDRIGEQSVDVLDVNHITGLSKGQAFIRMNGGELWKVRFPLYNKKDNIKLPKNVIDVANSMNERYETGDHWWEEAA